MIIRDEEHAVQHPEMAGILFCSAHLRLCWYAAKLVEGVPTIEVNESCLLVGIAAFSAPHTNKGVMVSKISNPSPEAAAISCPFFNPLHPFSATVTTSCWGR